MRKCPAKADSLYQNQLLHQYLLFGVWVGEGRHNFCQKNNDKINSISLRIYNVNIQSWGFILQFSVKVHNQHRALGVYNPTKSQKRKTLNMCVIKFYIIFYSWFILTLTRSTSLSLQRIVTLGSRSW